MKEVKLVLDELHEIKKQLQTPAKRLLTVEETAHYCGLSPRTIRNGLGPKAPKPFPIKPVRLAGRVLFRREDLDRHIDKLSYQVLAEMGELNNGI